MMQQQSSSSRTGRGGLMAAALIAAVSLGGCAGSPGFSTSAGDATPYQVAGPMVAKGAPMSPNHGCSTNAAGFQVECGGFPQYDGP